ncbi:MAG: hypothetical protein EPO24_14865 [Bacteroidetes bacterium]|nr:MAG: hypothetical protein EPO24_14865 [Bacteroidota bacterium]
MKRILILLTLAWLMLGGLQARETPANSFSRIGGYRHSKVTVNFAKQALQSAGEFKVWLSNMMVMGLSGFDNNPPGDDCNPNAGLGAVYPASACVEHLFGAGPWVGGIVNGTRYVTEGYNGNLGYGYMIPEIRDTARDRMWTTSEPDSFPDNDRPGFYKTATNRRDVDDDGDGKINEDELDGLDNDGDWVIATDDIGADGIPDSLEYDDCFGEYDPVTNPDPAYDNWTPTKEDRCHPDALGRFPLMRDKNKYTEKNGIPDHGEPHVDEDYAAYSDNDIYCNATDTFRTPSYSDHFPLGIKVWQKSYAWNSSFAENIIFFEYSFINVGRNIIRDAYVGFFADMDVGPINRGSYWTRNYAAYLESVRTAYIHNPVDRGSTPLGLTVLKTPRPLDQLTYTFQWHDFDPPCGGFEDEELYSCMSCEAFGFTNCVKPDQSQYALDDTRFGFYFGPFNGDSTEGFRPGDTLKIAVALVTGDGVEKGDKNLLANARKALLIYSNDYRKPKIPPSPCLDTTIGFKKVTLRWRRLGDERCVTLDPLEAWDDSNKFIDALPDTHWRRINPPPGHVKGGRYFEGFRLYRSEDPAGSKSSFTLVKQFDVADGMFGYDTGIDTFFVDTNLFRGKTYWYSVTSYGMPTLSIIERPDSLGNVTYDSLVTDGGESDVLENAIRVNLPFSVSEQLGEVLVVPNPYRVDEDYTLENGGWEGRRSTWSEGNRLLKFIHLPRKATIRVFTLAGDLVTTLEHDAGNEDRGELEWNILSESNRALASGIYVYTVESDYGRQIGKFVLIR